MAGLLMLESIQEEDLPENNLNDINSLRSELNNGEYHLMEQALFLSDTFKAFSQKAINELMQKVYKCPWCNTKPLLHKMIRVMQPHLVKNRSIIIVMDYYFYEDSNKPDLFYQKNFYEANKKSFRFIERIDGSKAAVFKYIGGKGFEFNVSEREL